MVSLSERERIRTFDRLLRRQMLYPAELRTLKLSGRQDSNLRPPGPKPGAMTGLRYAPIEVIFLTRITLFFVVANV